MSLGLGGQQPKEGLFSNQQDVPDANTLLSLKLLKDANPDAFQGLAQEETRFLAASLALVRSDPYLKLKMGNDSISAAINLAGVLKNRAEKKHLEHRIDATADALLAHEFNEEGGLGRHLMPLGDMQMPVKIEENGVLSFKMKKPQDALNFNPQ